MGDCCMLLMSCSSPNERSDTHHLTQAIRADRPCIRLSKSAVFGGKSEVIFWITPPGPDAITLAGL